MMQADKWIHWFKWCVCVQAHERLEDVKLEAVQENNIELVTEILGDISGLSVRDNSAAELSKILQEPHFQVPVDDFLSRPNTSLISFIFRFICSDFLFSFQSLLEAHDMVASKCYEAQPPPELTNDAAINSALMQADAVRMIGIRKKAGEPLVCVHSYLVIYTVMEKNKIKKYFQFFLNFRL